MCLEKINILLQIAEKAKNLLSSISLHKKQEESTLQDINRDFPYYFEDYTKHVTIYKNGNGIIINSATLVVTDLKRFNKIYRKLNIEDGKVISNFPSLEQMKNTPKKDRFVKFGFWYYSECDIIDNVKEYYWSDTDKAKEDKKIKGNPKELRWTFNFNKGRIEELHAYKIIYVISIKGMYPIDNGILNLDTVNDQNSLEENSSEIDIIQKIKQFKYIISFEDGITLENTPKCEVCNQRCSYGENTPIPEEKEYNVLFNKYTFNVDEPILGSKIKTYWKFKQQ